MDILIDENIPFLAEALNENPENLFRVKRFQGRTLASEALEECIALCIRSTTRINAALLQNTPVRFIGTATSGSEHVDTDFLQEQGIFFRDARGCNANSVAEYVVFAMLLWAEQRDLMQKKQALRGKTLGIIGYGHIGRRVAALATKLGMRVLVNDPPFAASGGRFGGEVEEMHVEKILEEADILTNHVPLIHTGTYQTSGLLGKRDFVRMRPLTLVIHASRGGVVAEDALWERLAADDISAAIDVWQNEPLVNKTLAEGCLLATPHIAGYSFEGKVNGSVMIARELERFVKNVLGTQLHVNWNIFENALERDYPVITTFEDHHLLLQTLRTSRMLEADTSAFLHSLEETEPAVAFDRLRKTYPQRREILA